MAFNGVLFQFGDYIFPNKYIEWGSYDSAPGQRQSLDAYTDANGVTHDNALEHSKTEIKFTTLPMKEADWEEIMLNVRRNYINFNARDANCTYFNFETCQYETGHFYLDKNFRASADIENGKLQYNRVQWTFIEY